MSRKPRTALTGVPSGARRRGLRDPEVGPEVQARGVDERGGDVPGIGQLKQPVTVDGCPGQRGIQLRQLDIAGNAHHLGRHPQVVTGGVELAPQAGSETRVRVVERGHDGVETAVSRHQAGRRLLADARHTRQPVARVTPQCRQVGVGGGRNPILGQHRSVVEDLQLGHPPAAVQHPYRPVVVDDLEQVPIAGRNLDRRRFPYRQRSDHVVGLVVGRAHRRDPERVQDLQDDRHLAAEVVRHDLDVSTEDAMFLVRVDQRDPPRRSPVLVQGADDARGPTAADECRDHVEEAPHGIDRRSIPS